MARAAGRGVAPLLLAVESATPALSVALLRGSELLHEQSSAVAGRHAERLLPMIEQLLQHASVRESDVEAFAVSIGPGSFTSLRVGVATVKGLAFATARPAVPVSTLAALAWSYARERRPWPDDLPIAAVLDARRGELYAALFDVQGAGPRPLLPGELLAPRLLAQRLPEACRVVGEGAAILRRELGERLGPGVEIPPDGNISPSARSVGEIGAVALRAGGAIDPRDLAPDYLRRADAALPSSAVPVDSR